MALSALSFAPLVRHVALAAAAKRRLSMRIGAVHAAWWGVRLSGVELRPEGVSGVQASVEHLRVALDWKGGLRQVALSGVRLYLDGSQERLSADLRAWRSRTGTAPQPAGHAPPMEISGLSLSWRDVVATEPRVEAQDVGLVSDDRGTRVRIPTARVHFGAWTLTLGEASVDLDSSRLMRGGHATTAVVRYAQRIESDADTLPTPEREPGPALQFPDLQRLRASLRATAEYVGERALPNSGVQVDAFTWQFARPGERVDLTVGPAPLIVSRLGSALTIRFSTDASTAGTPLALDVLLPENAADVAVTLSGGPVSLALLGIREGAAGLVDVHRATINGRARMVLAGDGSALTFDGEGGCHRLSARNARLALDVVRDVSLEIRARGVLAAQGELRIDDFGVALGSIQLNAAGHLEQDRSHLAGVLHVEVPRLPCQSLLDSTPAALLPEIHGTSMAGTFEGRGRVEFDTRSLDQLKLEYEIADRCRIAMPPEGLAPERFEQPFVHRVYLPDGSTSEETTGPGAENWTPLNLISPYMQVAVLTTEDGAFLHHHGFNHAAIRSSLIANLKGGRFIRGASTITMQLAKNLFLSRDKTVSRKLEEVILTDYLEQAFSKQQLMELYLNVIEFGPSVYGITAGAEHYFGRSPAELNLAECMFLASILPAPVRLGGAMRETGRVPSHWMHLVHSLIQTAHRTGRITDAELAEAEDEPIAFWNGVDRPPPRPPVLAQRRIDTSIEDAPTDSTLPDVLEDGP